MRTGIGFPFENPREVRKPGLLPQGKSFEAERERLKSLERNERVFKGQPDTGGERLRDNKIHSAIGVRWAGKRP